MDIFHSGNGQGFFFDEDHKFLKSPSSQKKKITASNDSECSFCGCVLAFDERISEDGRGVCEPCYNSLQR